MEAEAAHAGKRQQHIRDRQAFSDLQANRRHQQEESEQQIPTVLVIPDEVSNLRVEGAVRLGQSAFEPAAQNGEPDPADACEQSETPGVLPIPIPRQTACAVEQHPEDDEGDRKMHAHGMQREYRPAFERENRRAA